MLNIDEIQNGIVIDHIKAGTAVGLMDLLGIKSNRTASVALIQNARSSKSPTGRKDIIKVEGDASWLNLDVLAYSGRAGLPRPGHHGHHHPGRQARPEGKAPAPPPAGEHRPLPQPALHLHRRGGVRPDL